MTKQLQAQVDIQASAGRIWEVLTDLPAYPEWNPFITRSTGAVQVGGRLTNRMQPVGGRAVTLRPTVLAVEPGRELRWLGRLFLPGLLDAEHRFTIEPLGGGRVRLTQHEEFRGLLAGPLGRSLDRHTLPAFDLMNQALKARAERSPAAEPGAPARPAEPVRP